MRILMKTSKFRYFADVFNNGNTADTEDPMVISVWHINFVVTNSTEGCRVKTNMLKREMKRERQSNMVAEMATEFFSDRDGCGVSPPPQLPAVMWPHARSMYRKWVKKGVTFKICNILTKKWEGPNFMLSTNKTKDYLKNIYLYTYVIYTYIIHCCLLINNVLG